MKTPRYCWSGAERRRALEVGGVLGRVGVEEAGDLDVEVQLAELERLALGDVELGLSSSPQPATGRASAPRQEQGGEDEQEAGNACGHRRRKSKRPRGGWRPPPGAARSPRRSRSGRGGALSARFHCRSYQPAEAIRSPILSKKVLGLGPEADPHVAHRPGALDELPGGADRDPVDPRRRARARGSGAAPRARRSPSPSRSGSAARRRGSGRRRRSRGTRCAAAGTRVWKWSQKAGRIARSAITRVDALARRVDRDRRP